MWEAILNKGDHDAKTTTHLYRRVIPHEAVQLARTSDKPKGQIARELGISESAL